MKNLQEAHVPDLEPTCLKTNSKVIFTKESLHDKSIAALDRIVSEINIYFVKW